MALFDIIRRQQDRARSLPPEQAPLVEGPSDGIPAFGQMLGAQGAMPGPGTVFEQRDEAPISRITPEVLREATHILQKYKTGKARMDRRIIENEEWWKMRHWNHIREKGTTDLKTKSAWLVNVVLSKHADAMDAFPEPNCLPREPSDQGTAKLLSSILPVVLQQADFELAWSENWWKKLKAGFAVYGVFWDGAALNGLGDIAIRRIDPLNLYWEPGISDIQDSQNVFHVELRDNNLLKEQYPQLEGKLGGKNVTVSKYLYDDTVDTSDKSPVIDWYYKKSEGGKDVLHYVKYVGETVLYATEDDVVEPAAIVPGQPTQSMAQRGLYDHGMYPFFFDVLFPEEGTPGGFGYIDICKDAQRQIDLMNNAIVANAICSATPRWFKRGDGDIDEAEFADWTKPFVHVQGDLEDRSIREITVQPLSGNYINILQTKIDEMKETSGNRDVNNGGASPGVTAASAIAAMQEQSGKLSRDQIQQSYRCFRDICYCVIELIRQFYDAPRQFRITGPQGMMFAQFDNTMMLPQSQGQNEFGMDMGYRIPLYDVEVNAQKQTAYSKLSYNELAIQFFQLGFFNPALADQALAALEMMDFKGKEEMRMRIQQSQMQFQMMQMAQMQAMDAKTPRGEAKAPSATDDLGGQKKENAIVARAREQANASTQPR